MRLLTPEPFPLVYFLGLQELPLGFSAILSYNVPTLCFWNNVRHYYSSSRFYLTNSRTPKRPPTSPPLPTHISFITRSMCSMQIWILAGRKKALCPVFLDCKFDISSSVLIWCRRTVSVPDRVEGFQLSYYPLFSHLSPDKIYWLSLHCMEEYVICLFALC